MKQFIPFLLFVIGFIVPINLHAQQQYLTRNGIITFDSKLNSFVPVKAENSSVSAILNVDGGEIAVLALVKGFSFKNSLMEEHFNESSHAFPTFQRTQRGPSKWGPIYQRLFPDVWETCWVPIRFC